MLSLDLVKHIARQITFSRTTCSTTRLVYETRPTT
jgi:hypothetical protein